jgi:hypothetical protein
MLSPWLALLFRRRAAAPLPAEPPHVAARVDPAALGQRVPEGKFGCVFRGELLVNACRERLPCALADGEACWLVPGGDVPLTIWVSLGERSVRGDVWVCFEPESLLGQLVAGRDALAVEDLAALVASEFSGLLGLVGRGNAEEVVALDAGDRERLRANLSLLLQTRGLRCTGLANLSIAAPALASESETTFVPEVQEPSAAEPAEPLPANLEQQVERELRQSVEHIHTDADWDAFMADLEHCGFRADEPQAVELNALGDDVVDGQVSANEAAQRIRALAEAAASQAAIPRPELGHWSGLALRLRLMDQGPESTEPSAPSPSAVCLPPRRKRIWTWWMLRRSADARLQQSLRQTLAETRQCLAGYRQRLTEVRHAARIRELDGRLGLGEDLLASVPALRPSVKRLRPDRAKVRELVTGMERALTAADMVQAQTRALLSAAPGSEDWGRAVDECATALEALCANIRSRHAVR